VTIPPPSSTPQRGAWFPCSGRCGLLPCIASMRTCSHKDSAGSALAGLRRWRAEAEEAEQGLPAAEHLALGQRRGSRASGVEKKKRDTSKRELTEENGGGSRETLADSRVDVWWWISDRVWDWACCVRVWPRKGTWSGVGWCT
jgi:hypothetical protein